ncbi:MAG: flavin reductase family protein [Bacteroidota bacterium]|nr:flavin reductase family protein [Bacteroidota bacterium]
MLDASTFKSALRRFASGVTVVSTREGDRLYGITVSAFCSVSLNPPLVLVSIDRNATSHDPLARTGLFAVSFLQAEQVELSERFAGRIPLEDRFEGVRWRSAQTGCPILEEALAYLDCRLWAAYPGGDHTLFVGEVLEAGWRTDGEPLLYYDGRYHGLKLLEA